MSQLTKDIVNLGGFQEIADKQGVPVEVVEIGIDKVLNVAFTSILLNFLGDKNTDILSGLARNGIFLSDTDTSRLGVDYQYSKDEFDRTYRAVAIIIIQTLGRMGFANETQLQTLDAFGYGESEL